MEKKRVELLPGVYLTTLLTDKFKTNCISLNILRPLRGEEAAMNALLPDVLLRGCKMCPDMGAISAWLDERYGAGIQATARKKGEVQAIGFFMDYIDDAYIAPGETLTADMCHLLGSFLLEPVVENGVFVESYVEGEKANLVNAIMSQVNDKRTYASVRLRQEMFAGEAYGISKYGEKDEVAAITPENLYAHYRRLLETSKIEILFTGSTDVDALADLLRDALKTLPRGELVPVGTAQGSMPRTVREISETMEVTQGKLVMGFRTGITADMPEYPAMLLLNGVFGGSLTSKLFMNVRERLSLCYYASSGIERFKGVMVVSSGVDTDKYEVVKHEILNQFDACRRGDITEEELESTRSYLMSALRTNEDSPYNMDDFYLGQIIGDYDYTPATLAQRLKTLTVADLMAAADMVQLDTIYFLKGGEA